MSSDEWNWFDSLPGDAQEELVIARQIVRAMASGYGTWRDKVYEDEHCTWCPAYAESMEQIQHTSECPVTKARALVRKWDEEAAKRKGGAQP